MITLDVEQGSTEWVSARLGIPTASCFDKIVTSKGEPSKQRDKYLCMLAGERITGASDESFRSGFMQRGNDVEDEARRYYALVKETKVERVGVCYMDERRRVGCSPDGLVGKTGGLQIKCPSAAIHIGYLLENKLPTDYIQQVQGELLVTGRKWWDFISYYPGLRALIVRVERDEVFITKLKESLEQFCDDLDQLIERVSA